MTPLRWCLCSAVCVLAIVGMAVVLLLVLPLAWVAERV